MGTLDGTQGSTLPVSVFLFGCFLPVTVCPDKLILSRSRLNVSSSSSDSQDTSIQAFLDFPSCDGAALVVVVYGSRPGVLTQ